MSDELWADDDLDEDEEFDEGCMGYPEHDYEFFDGGDGWTIFHCARCGAELQEEDQDD